MDNDDPYSREIGEALGYPSCCIDDFVARLNTNTPFPPDREFRGTGYVPCAACNRIILALGHVAFVASRIVPNRRIAGAFPNHRLADPVMVDIFKRHRPEALPRYLRSRPPVMPLRGLIDWEPTALSFHPTKREN